MVLFEIPGIILALELCRVFDHPDLSWAKIVLVTLGSPLSVSEIGGGCRFTTLLLLKLSRRGLVCSVSAY